MYFLLVRPNNLNDRVAQALSSFCQELIREIEADYSRLQFAELSDGAVVRLEVERQIQNAGDREESIFGFYGHGRRDSLRGWDNSAVVDLSNGVRLKDWHVYAIACLSCSQLGPACMVLGSKSYIGFKGKLALHLREDGSAYPGFRETVNAGLRFALRNGRYDARRAYKKILREHERWIEYYTEAFKAIFEVRPNGDFDLLRTEIDNIDEAIHNARILEYNRGILSCLNR